MKKWFFLILVSWSTLHLLGQQSDQKQLHDNAKTYIRQGDYNNAILILNRLLQQDADNLEVLKDLALTHYLKKDYVRALETAKAFAGRPDADVQSYQILGLIYKDLEEKKDAEKMYKVALKKFGNSGALHSEYGELLWNKKEYADAAKTWENGIKADPNFSGNYYNAAKYYYLSPDKVWGLIYGETFINLESYSPRTEEIKNLLLDGYKKLFSEPTLAKGQNMNNGFIKAFIDVMQKNASLVNTGITAESLSTLRNAFITDWYKLYAPRFPLRLFEHQNQLASLNLFEAYNQWIFVAPKDSVAYKSWTDAHSQQYSEFLRLQQNRVFKIPVNQYYQTATK